MLATGVKVKKWRHLEISDRAQWQPKLLVQAQNLTRNLLAMPGELANIRHIDGLRCC